MPGVDKGNGALPVQDGIQFDIENCCNMTLCETVRVIACALIFISTFSLQPCFDPPSRVPKSHQKRCGGAGDKRSLLAGCDED